MFFLDLKMKINQAQIADLNNLIESNRSKYAKPTDALIVAFTWWLIQNGFNFDHSSVRKNDLRSISLFYLF